MCSGPEGDLFAPTFTYSYMNGEMFDARRDALEGRRVVGDLVRARPGATRSLDGNFSNAGIGPQAAAFLERTNKCSFGPGTFYDRLVEADAKILLIGVRSHRAAALHAYRAS